MNGRTTITFPRVAVALLTAFVFLFLVDDQAGQPKKNTPGKGKTSPLTLTKERAYADSLVASALADSLRKVAEAVDDSLRRGYEADSLDGLKEETTKVFHGRTLKNDAFAVGERLVYNVNYGFITAGEAVMQIPSFDSVAGRKVYSVEFAVNSLPSFSWIYKVQDMYRTFIDVQWLAPVRFEQHIREGTYRRDFIADFDQVRNVAVTTEGTYPVPPYVHDIMSAFYYARTLDWSDFRPGEGVMLNNFYRDKTHDLMVKFLGKQELEVAAGTFKTLVVEPLVKEGGLFKSEGRIVIWITDDERKVPVRVNTKVVIGSIDTELREYSGLAGPLRARLD
jgi:hypothetical protein